MSDGSVFSRREIEEALDHMDTLRNRSSVAGDWTIWAECLTEDVEFHDSTYGAYRGKQAVSDFVVAVHAPFPTLRYQRVWSLIDADRAEVLFEQQMILPEPDGYTGTPFAVDVWSRHRYAGEGLWSLKQDVTLSAKQADTNFRAWFAATRKHTPRILDQGRDRFVRRVLRTDAGDLDAGDRAAYIAGVVTLATADMGEAFPA